VIFIDFFTGGARSNGLDCSERSNLLSKKYVSLVPFATVWIFKACQRERIKALLTNHELKSVLQKGVKWRWLRETDPIWRNAGSRTVVTSC